MSVAILSIGTELTRGELLNRNAHELAARLTEEGHHVTEVVTVDDDPVRIQNALQRLSQTCSAVISTGGLGPTTDDLTTQCAADFLGVPLVRDEASLAHIRSLFESRGRTMRTTNEKQADFPKDSVIIFNPVGTAPGFMIRKNNCKLFFLPGVPTEMRAMFESTVLGQLDPPENVIGAAYLQTFGLPESEVAERLDGMEEELGVTIGYRASYNLIEVKTLAPGATREEAQDRAAHALKSVKTKLADAVFAEGRVKVAGAVVMSLLATGKTLALAESCTGGLVGEMVTDISGASQAFLGGVISYSNEVKKTMLGVAETDLKRHGAVSELIAREMAEGARARLNADFALSLTGIAGPGGGSKEKPVGLVHWAVSGERGTTAFSHVFRGDRAQVRQRAATAGLHSLLTMIRETGP